MKKIKKRKRRKGKKIDQKKLQSAIYKIFSNSPKKRYNARQLSAKLYRQNSKDSIISALGKLQQEGVIRHIKDGKYQFYRKSTRKQSKTGSTGIQIKGKIDATRSGAAYLITEGDYEDIYISPKNLASSLHRDKVIVELLPIYGRRRAEGKVISIIQRASHKFVGTLRIYRNSAMVYVEHPKIQLDIQLKLDDLNSAKDGDKVIVEVTQFGDGKHKFAWGKVDTILTGQHVNDIEMQSILINNGFFIDFHQDILAEAEQLKWEIKPEDLASRKDLRSVPSFTIDPVDAKDFDDALSYRETEDGYMEIGVHIADVSHYVKPGTQIDKEAFHRSTSVYLVDRVAPMLPEVLSNDLCSLRPDEDKFCFSVLFYFNREFKILKRWIGKTIIHSDKRFSYDEAQQLIEKGEGAFAKELRQIDLIAGRLREQRFKQGAISLESEEVKFQLDAQGKPLGIYLKERKDAHLLIEDFMLLANRSVAEYIIKKSKSREIPFVYRVHDLPDSDKLIDLALFAYELGLQLNMDTPGNIVKSFRQITQAAKDDDRFKVLEPLAIRTMSKAVYTTNNIGHYGLAFPYYTHFTSPIRRYSDVLAHRILEQNLNTEFRTEKAKLESQCLHISAQERKAMEAERESIKYKQAEFIQNHVGEVFEGIITGFIDKGIFVELKKLKIEGMVVFSSLDEPFVLKGGNTKAIAKYSGLILHLGQEVKVRVSDVDLSRRQIELALLKQ